MTDREIDRDIARAQALGRAAARAGKPVTDCPYARHERVLRRRWVLAYSAAGGARRIVGLAARARAALGGD